MKPPKPNIISRWNKLADSSTGRRKLPMMLIRGRWYAWEEGDRNGVFVSDKRGKEYEFKYRDVDQIKESINEAASIGKASMKFLIDRLINVMEKYRNEREFITHMKKEIHLKPEDSKKVWKLYWRTKKIGKAGVLWEKDWKKLLAIKLGIRESMKMIKLKDILNEKSLNEAPEHQLAGELDKVSNSIFKIMKRYEKKADVEGMVRAWMRGLHSRLKRSGVKI